MSDCGARVKANYLIKVRKPGLPPQKGGTAEDTGIGKKDNWFEKRKRGCVVEAFRRRD